MHANFYRHTLILKKKDPILLESFEKHKRPKVFIINLFSEIITDEDDYSMVSSDKTKLKFFYPLTKVSSKIPTPTTTVAEKTTVIDTVTNNNDKTTVTNNNEGRFICLRLPMLIHIVKSALVKA